MEPVDKWNVPTWGVLDKFVAWQEGSLLNVRNFLREKTVDGRSTGLLQNNFVKKEEIGRRDALKTVIEKTHAINMAVLIKDNAKAVEDAGCFCLLKSDLISLSSLLPEESDESKEEVSEVDLGGQSSGWRRRVLRSIALIEETSWHFDANGNRLIPKSAEMHGARMALFNLYLCDDYDIKEKAINNLIELLDCDPLTVKSAFGLVELQKKLLSRIEISISQNLPTTLQRLLIEAYAKTLESILIHAKARHLNALSPVTKEEIWSGAEELLKSNVVGDPAIWFWAKYAAQGAQHIKTAENVVTDRMEKIAKISLSLLDLAFAIYSGNDFTISVDRLFDSLKSAFHHVAKKKSWFEQILMLKKLCRHWLDDERKFNKIADLLREIVGEEISEELAYGVIELLEFVVLRTKRDLIKEECLKLLILAESGGGDGIKKRIDGALRRFANAADRKLELTARFISVLRGIGEDSAEIKDFISSGEKISVHDIHYHVLEYMVATLMSSEEDIDYGGNAPLTLLSSLVDGRMVAPFLNIMRRVSFELDNRNVKGETPYHIAVKKNNCELVKVLADSMAMIDINAAEYEGGDTALHYVVKIGSYQILNLLTTLNADLNRKNFRGSTPLHLAVKLGRSSFVRLLLDKGARTDTWDQNGDTPLKSAIGSDNLLITWLLLYYGAQSNGYYDKVTPTMIAARVGAEKILKFLIILSDGVLNPLECLEIKQFISFIDGSISCSYDFARFHIEQMDSNPNYKKSFGSLEESPLLYIDKTGKIEQMSEQIEIGRHNSFGNSRVMELAKDGQKAGSLKEAVVKDKKSVNRSNFMGLTPLHVAAIFQNREAIEILCDQRANVNAQDICGFTPLHFAVYMGYAGIAKILLSRGGKINMPNSFGETPLLIYCGRDCARRPESLISIADDPDKLFRETSDIDMIDFLISRGAAVSSFDKGGNNALHLAAAYGSPRLIKYFCSEYPDLFWQKNFLGDLPIQTAVKSSRVDYVDHFICDAWREDPYRLRKKFYEMTDNRTTIGGFLVKINYLKLLEKLFTLFPDTAREQEDSPAKYTPLHISAKQGKRGVIKLYAALKIELNLLDSFNNTPAHLAALKRKPKYLKLLIESGADLSIKNRNGRNALHLAATQNDCRQASSGLAFECFREIHEARPDLMAETDNNGDTVLHLACRWGNYTTIRYICERASFLINSVNDRGSFPLHLACSNGYFGVVKYLIAHKAFLDAKNGMKMTPLMIAAGKGYVKIVNLLLERDADIRQRDERGETAFHKAVFNRQDEVVRALLDKESALFCPPWDKLVNIADIYGNTPLLKMGQRSNFSRSNYNAEIEILRLLLSAGADVDHRNARGEGFMHFVCRNGLNELLNYTSVHYMDQKRRERRVKFNLFCLDKDKNGILHKAVEGNQFTTVIRLKKMVAIDKKNEKGLTPFLLAISLGFVDIADYLFDCGADPGKKQKEGKNLFHLLLERERLGKKVLFFLRKMANVRPSLLAEKDKEGRTPLHVLAEGGHRNALNMLLGSLHLKPAECRKYVYMPNDSGQNAYEIAESRGYEKLAREIRSYDARLLGSAARERR